MWQAIWGRLPGVDQIHKRNSHVSNLCALCGVREDSNHVPFNCHMAKLMWSCIGSSMLVDWSPSSFSGLCALSNTLVGQR